MADNAAPPTVPATSSGAEDDLAPTETAGYIAPEKKTLSELKELDKNDESLNRWKESLLKNMSSGPQEDSRKLTVLSLSLEVEGREDVVLDLSTPEKLEAVKKTPLVIKEGVDYRMKVQFRVQHDVISGLKYLHVVKRSGLRVDKTEEMIGSYAPRPEPYEKKFAAEQAPSGMLARSVYSVRSKFIDDDKVTHLEWDWTFQIKKDWN